MRLKLIKVILSIILCFSLLPLVGTGFAWADEDPKELGDVVSGDETIDGDADNLDKSSEEGDYEEFTAPPGSYEEELVFLAPEDTGLIPLGSASVEYRTHVQNIGWQDWAKDGAQAGTTGMALRVEAIHIKLEGTGFSGSIEYRTHVQNIGWQGWVKDGAQAGTTGRALQAEAISIRLTGAVAADYDVYYRVHVQNLGWLGWASNGEDAGSAGFAYRMEAIEIRLVEKAGGAPPSPLGKCFIKPAMALQVCAHVQDVGWQNWVGDGATAGTTGRALRLEAFCIQIAHSDYAGSVEYRAYVSNIGWQKWVSDGATAGTTGQARQVEAVEMRLTGVLATKYDIYYRVHIPNLGWLGWASNGETAGTTDLSCRIEAVQVRLVLKGATTPTPTANHYLAVSYTSEANVAGLGWLKQVVGRGVTGTTGQSRQMEAFKLAVKEDASIGISGGIEYRAYVAETGWQDWVADGVVAGTLGENRRIEAIQIRLTGNLAQYFDIYYRAHCAGIGWMGWAANGASAGTSKNDIQLEAFEIAVVIKGTAAPGSTAQPYTDILRIRVLDPSKPMIALTFDDGPSAYTTRLLDILDRNNARATFFVVGRSVNVYPNVVLDAYRRGNEVAGHAMYHNDYTLLSYSAIQNDILTTSQLIRNITGNQPPPFYRAPGGALNQNVMNASAGVGHSMIQWNIDPRDWEVQNANMVYNNVMNSARPGAIVVLHDSHSTTVTAMERVIPDLIARGYQIVTVSELLYYSNRPIVPGQVYNSG